MKNTIMATLFVASMMTAGSVLAAGDAARGETLSASCAACHGADGNSPSPMFPKLAGLGEKYLSKQLMDIKSGERPIGEMTGLLDALDKQALDDIAAFFSSKALQLSGATDEELLLNSGRKISALKLGENLYRAGNLETHVPSCSGCHSPRGQGNSPAGYPRLSGQHADYIEKQLLAFQAGTRANDGDSRIMRSVAEHMSAAEIKAVAAYIAGLH